MESFVQLVLHLDQLISNQLLANFERILCCLLQLEEAQEKRRQTSCLRSQNKTESNFISFIGSNHEGCNHITKYLVSICKQSQITIQVNHYQKS